MDKKTLQTSFKTSFGWIIVTGTENFISKCSLSNKKPAKIKTSEPIPPFFKSVQNQIVEYCNGKQVDFSNVPVSLENMTTFQKRVLSALRDVKYGNTVTYKHLARLTGNPKSARAIGQVMAKNPIPIIIPCHRVIRSDGKMGGFSAMGGIKTKRRMIEMENNHT